LLLGAATSVFALAACDAILDVHHHDRAPDGGSPDDASVAGADAGSRDAADGRMDAMDGMDATPAHDAGDSGRTACDAGETKCVDAGAIQSCGESGQWQAPNACTKQACYMNRCTGSCSPGTVQCVDPHTLETCNLDGEWSTSSCNGQACESGQCVGSCSPGTVMCADPQHLSTCGSDGQWGNPAVCDGGDAGDAGYCNGSGSCGPGGPSSGGTCAPDAGGVDGGLPLQNGYSTSVGTGGYAFTYGDYTQGGLSSMCLSQDQLCGQGETGVMGGATWGSGIGVMVDRTDGDGGEIPYAPSAPGLTYTIAPDLPSQGMRISLNLATDAGQVNYYCDLQSTHGTIPWTAFNTEPWNLSNATYLSARPTALVNVSFLVNASNTPTPFDFCVTELVIDEVGSE
jgi:hypothetical protein